MNARRPRTAPAQCGILSAHAHPLTRDLIRHDLDKLEALGFFARVRYATSPRGGYTAYSFRHPKRTDLITAFQQWAAANAKIKAKAATNRQADLAAFRQPPPAQSEVSGRDRMPVELETSHP